MTIREIVSTLRKQGIKISVYERKDGGLVITSINGTSYRGKTGNKVARFMINESLSERRSMQLERITRQRNWSKPSVKTTEELNRYLKRVQRKWRKAGIKGTISKRNLKNMIQERGLEGATNYLSEMERHAEGLAYNSQIDGLIARLEQDLVNVESDEEEEAIEALIDKLKRNRDNISFEMVQRIYDEIYNWESDAIEIDTLISRIDSILS